VDYDIRDNLSETDDTHVGHVYITYSSSYCH
jgi:hypothetical protein